MMLTGKVAIITGASKGIGRATALTFAQSGAELILNGRDSAALDTLSEEIQSLGGKAPIIYPYDVSDYASVKECFKNIKKNVGRLDILVNNAGVLEDALLGMITEKQIQDVLAINLQSVMYHMQFASRIMMKQRSGSIINISSIIGKHGNSGQVVYGASKAGVIGATMSAAKELAPNQIRVNAIAPGFINTEMVKKIPESKYKERLESIKMGKIGDPEDVANVALFLASELSSYVTGQTIGVDGGMVI